MLGLRVGGEWRLQIHNDTDFVLDRYFVYQISVHKSVLYGTVYLLVTMNYYSISMAIFRGVDPRER